MLFIGSMIVYYRFFADNDSDFHITKQEFAALQDDELIETAYEWTMKYDPVIHGKQAYYKAPEAVQNVIAVLMFDGEVLNGGFVQFYYNRRDELWINYAQAFTAIRLPEVAGILSASDEVFNSIKGTMPPQNGDTIAFSNWYKDNPLCEFDDPYADLEEEINAAVIRYIRENIGSFGD
ncbi:MAG: DMP19 family protein [Clostridiales bacterium]|nr:DMP19 family protein [Clostridiales bacterium]